VRPIDPENVARAVFVGQAAASPKTADWTVEMVPGGNVAKDLAVRARTAAMTSLKEVIVNVPRELREELDHHRLPRASSTSRGHWPTAYTRYSLPALSAYVAESAPVAPPDGCLRLPTGECPVLPGEAPGTRSSAEFRAA
jgi:hypothetical protein